MYRCAYLRTIHHHSLLRLYIHRQQEHWKTVFLQIYVLLSSDVETLCHAENCMEQRRCNWRSPGPPKHRPCISRRRHHSEMCPSPATRHSERSRVAANAPVNSAACQIHFSGAHAEARFVLVMSGAAGQQASTAGTFLVQGGRCMTGGSGTHCSRYCI